MRRTHTTASFGVIGLGRFGSALVKTLAEAGQEVIAIDKDEQKVRAVRKYTDFAFVVESLTAETLEETGVQNCQTVTICIGETMDISILTTMLVIKMGVPRVSSKANSQAPGEVLKLMGATLVYPEADMAVRMGRRLIFGNLVDYIALDDHIEVRRIQVGGVIVGKSVQSIDARRKYGINIIAIERDHQTMVDFSPQYEFAPGDIVTVIGKVEKIETFEQEIKS